MNVMAFLRALTFTLIFFLFSCGSDPAAGGDYDTAPCAGEATASIGESETFEEKFTTMRIETRMSSDTNMQSLMRLFTPYVTGCMFRELPRVNVFEKSDVDTLRDFAILADKLAGLDWFDVVADYASAYANAELSIAINITKSSNNMVTFWLLAVDCRRISHLASAKFTGTPQQVCEAIPGLCSAMAEKIKNVRVAVAVGPRRSAIDFDNTQDRQRTLNFDIRNLKNQPADIGTVTFTVGDPSSGKITISGSAVTGNGASTLFTMTARKANNVTCTYSNPYITIDTTAYLVPRCSYVLLIEGGKTFSTVQDPNVFCGPGGWVSISGSSTESGGCVIEPAEDGSVFAQGWNKEIHQSTGQARITWVNLDGGGGVTGGGSAAGTAKGFWAIQGNVSGGTLHIQEAISFGISGNLVAGSGFTTYSEFRNVSIPLQSGASVTVDGVMALWGGADPDAVRYSYTLTIKRARD